MRVVSLTCSNTEIVAALGLSHLLVGVDKHSDWPVEVVRDLPRVGPDLTVDLDLVASLQPDLVLASLTVPGHERVVAGLEERGLPFLAPEPTQLAHVARDIRCVAGALGHRARGEEVAAAFDEAIERETVAPGDVPILVEWWPRPVIVPGAESWVTELVARAGGVNLCANEPAKSLEVNADRVARAAAIVISWCGVPTRKYRTDVVANRPGWANVPAVRHGQIHPISEAYLGRPGPRLLDVAKLRG